MSYESILLNHRMKKIYSRSIIIIYDRYSQVLFFILEIFLPDILERTICLISILEQKKERI